MSGRSGALSWRVLAAVVAAAAGVGAYFALRAPEPAPAGPRQPPPLKYRPRQTFDSSGNIAATESMEKWAPSAPLEEVARHWKSGALRMKDRLDARLGAALIPPGERIKALVELAS